MTSVVQITPNTPTIDTNRMFVMLQCTHPFLQDGHDLLEALSLAEEEEDVEGTFEDINPNQKQVKDEVQISNPN